MTVALSELDAHEQPSDEMRAEWKHFSRLEPEVLLKDSRIDDPRRPPEETGFRSAGVVSQAQIANACAHLDPELEAHAQADAPILFHPLLPGLLVIPDLVPPPVQPVLLDKMLHRDLSDPRHQTNMHLHYDLPYPQDLSASSASSTPESNTSSPPRSFFSLDPDEPGIFQPKDPSVHRPLSARQVLQRRLHWLTLGGQYDWTARVYPDAEPPPFPADLAAFLRHLFPDTLAQAAIVNLYSPGDTMMMHRDVSEDANRGLVSLSLGCDGLFMIAPNGPPSPASGSPPDPSPPSAATADTIANDKRYLLLRLRSGDAIYMTREARYAWHGVPKVLRGTCPSHLQAWPARDDGAFAQWRGWMENKRINFNVRQMKD